MANFSLVFPGNGYVLASGIAPGTGDFTFTWWYKQLVPTTTFGGFISQVAGDDSGGGWSINHPNSSAGINCYLVNSGTYDQSAGGLTDDPFWHFGMYTRTGGNINLWQDGYIVQTIADSGFDINNAHNLAFGLYRSADTANNRLLGSMTKIGIWLGTALTQTQMQQLMAGLDPTTLSPTYYWPCTDGSGSTVTDVVAGNNGALTNVTWSSDVPPLPERYASNPIIVATTEYGSTAIAVYEPTPVLPFGTGNVDLYYTAADASATSVICKATCPIADFPTPADWTKVGTIIGHGTGGESGDACRPFVWTEDGVNLVLYYADSNATIISNLRYITSSDGGATWSGPTTLISTVTVALAFTGATGSTNVRMVLESGTYHLFNELAFSSGAQFRVTRWTSSSPTGTFTPQAIVTALAPVSTSYNWDAGGIVLNEGIYTCIYHANRRPDVAQSLMWIASNSSSIGDDTAWVVSPSNPFLQALYVDLPASPGTDFTIFQVADTKVVTVNAINYLTYDGDVNGTPLTACINVLENLSYNTSTAYSVSGTAGAFTLTGQATSEHAGRLFAGSAGSFALTGKTSTLSHGHPLSANTGSFALTGEPLSAKSSRPFSAAAGSFTLTGEAANILAGKQLQGSPGAFTVVGKPSPLTKSLTFSALAGAFTLTGEPTVLIGGKQLLGSPGSFVVTGGPATLHASRSLLANAGSLALTGQTTALSNGQHLTASAGTFQVTGRAISAAVARSLAGAVGTFIVSGQVAQLTASNQVTGPFFFEAATTFIGGAEAGEVA